MLDRCDSKTMAVFDTALAEARRLGHDYVGTEHLLLALALHREFLPEAAAVSAALESFIGKPPGNDTELLKTLGIDLERVRVAVRQTFGNDAVERFARRRVHQPWQPWRRPHRSCISILAGAMGVAPRVKQAFEHARLEADRRQQAMVDPAGLLLGMAQVEDALSNRLLQDLGIEPSNVRQALLEATD